MAFGNGITRMLTKPLSCAFDAFANDSNWRRIADASKAVRVEIKDHTRRVIEVYRQGRSHRDLKSAQDTIEDLMRQSGLIK